MLRGLLESEGITATLRDEVLSGVNPFLQPIIGGVKVAVPASDAGRALEVARSVGMLAGPGPDEPVEIPEEQWSAAAPGTEAPQAVAAPLWKRWPALLAVGAVLVALLRCGLGV